MAARKAQIRCRRLLVREGCVGYQRGEEANKEANPSSQGALNVAGPLNEVNGIMVAYRAKQPQVIEVGKLSW